MLKISFVIPAHNAACWAAHSIQSVLDQDYKDVECVVVNDASTDSTRELLDFYTAKDSRVKAIHNEKNLGRSLSRNRGTLAATGDIICVLDADDLAYKNRASLTAAKFKKGGVDVVYGGVDVIDALGLKKGELAAAEFDRERAWKEKTFGIVHSTLALRREVALDFPYEDGEVADLGVDDFSLYARLSAAGKKFAPIVGEKLGAYRVLAGSISGTRNPAKAEEVKAKILAGLTVPA